MFFESSCENKILLDPKHFQNISYDIATLKNIKKIHFESKEVLLQFSTSFFPLYNISIANTFENYHQNTIIQLPAKLYFKNTLELDAFVQNIIRKHLIFESYGKKTTIITNDKSLRNFFLPYVETFSSGLILSLIHI